MQNEVEALKHQITLSHLSQETLRKELQEKADVSVLLQEELRLSHNQRQQAREEVHVCTVYVRWKFTSNCIILSENDWKANWHL